MHIYGLYDGTDEPICRAGMETQTWRTDLQTQRWREKGESGTNGEAIMETHIYVKQTANGNLLYDSGNSKWGSITT